MTISKLFSYGTVAIYLCLMGILIFPNDEVIEFSDCVKFHPSLETHYNICAVPQEVAPSYSKYVLYINNKYKVPLNECQEIVDSAIKISAMYNIDLHLMLAIIEVESNFKCKVRSSKNARGLMGIRAKTEHGQNVWFKQLTALEIISHDNDLFKIYNNINAGGYIFYYLLNTCHGNINKALCAYLGCKNSAYLHKVKSKAKMFQKLN